MRRVARLRRWLRWKLSYANFIKDLEVDPAPHFGELVKARGIALVHVPKTGGIALSRALYGQPIGHRRWDQMRAVDPTGYESWLKLAVVREPVDRFLSAFDYLNAGGNNPFDRHFARLFVGADINRFATRLREPRFRTNVMSYWHFRTQASFVLSPDGLVMVDRLIPYVDLGPALAALGILEPSRSNVTPGARTQHASLTPATIEMIETLYADDFALYQFARSAQSIATFYRVRLPASSAAVSAPPVRTVPEPASRA